MTSCSPRGRIADDRAVGRRRLRVAGGPGTGADLAHALDAAMVADATFDLGAALRNRIADGTLMGVAPIDRF